jgi:hypothetical protein
MLGARWVRNPRFGRASPALWHGVMGVSSACHAVLHTPV